ncbi:hypothetical protein ACWCXH_32095 [Kitasatospora sp. NPDC001660]
MPAPRLVTSDPHRPGCGFAYRDAAGAAISDPDTLARVWALVIPPAWREVWICPHPRGHLQATGTDVAGRRQCLCHLDFRARQEAAKHAQVPAIAPRPPRLRRRVEHDLARRGLPPERVLACAARLLDLGFFRAGAPA